MPYRLLSVTGYMATLKVAAIMASASLRYSEFIVGIIMSIYSAKVLSSLSQQVLKRAF
jgi:hypothetical protein